MTRREAENYLQSSGYSEEQIGTIARAFEQDFEQEVQKEKQEPVEIFTDEQRAESIMKIRALIRHLEEAIDGELDHLSLTGYDLCFILHCIHAHFVESNEDDGFIDVLKDIYHKVWEYDIPSPGDVPEYIEHHEQMQDILKHINAYIEKYER